MSRVQSNALRAAPIVAVVFACAMSTPAYVRAAGAQPTVTRAAKAPEGSPPDIVRSWQRTPWKPINQGYFYSGFKSEAEYDDPKIKPTNPPPLRPEAQAKYDKLRQAAFDGRNPFDVTSDCSPVGVPFLIGAGGFEFEMLFSPQKIVVIHADGEIRRIWIDGRPHPKDFPVPQASGHSVGHWEGKTLVIDTVGFRSDRFIEPGLGFSDKLEVIERWTPMSGDRIRNEITFIDPDTFTRPWQSVRIYGRSVPKSLDDAALQFLESTCENNREVRTPQGVEVLGSDGKPLSKAAK